jgi:hypothetical protein
VQEKFNIAHLIGAVGVECILNYFKGTAAQIFGALLPTWTGVQENIWVYIFPEVYSIL